MKTTRAIASLVLFFNISTVEQQVRRTNEGWHNTFLIQNVLTSARASGSLELNGRCGPNILIPDLPSIREPQKPYSQSPADTLRYMFSVDSRTVVVSEESNGTIRMVEAGVQTDILHVRISHLSFNKISNPDEALGVVLGAPEVQSFIQTHGIGQPFNSLNGPFLPARSKVSPNPEVPNISGELSDITLADALDHILKTFPGFWLYQNWESFEGQRVVYFTLFPVPGKIWIGDKFDIILK